MIEHQRDEAPLMDAYFDEFDYDTADERLAMCDSYERTLQLFWEMAKEHEFAS